MIHYEHRLLYIWGRPPLSMKCRHIIITPARPGTPLCGFLRHVDQDLQCLILSLGLLSGLRPLRERHLDLSLPRKHAPALLYLVIDRLLQATYGRRGSLLGQALRWAPTPTPRGPAASSARLLVVLVVIEYHHFLTNDLSF